MFITVHNGMRIPLGQISAIGPCEFHGPDDPPTAHVYALGGQHFTVNESEVDRLYAVQGSQGGVVPAEEGYFVVEVPPDDSMADFKQGEFYREPVIAWLADAENLRVVPLTIDEVARNGAILRPDGKVVCIPGEGIFPTCASFEEVMRRRAAVRLARKEAEGTSQK